jgi:hypothetical protein
MIAEGAAEALPSALLRAGRLGLLRREHETHFAHEVSRRPQPLSIVPTLAQSLANH